MQVYRDLSVWQKSMDLVEEVYNITKRLPSSEQYSLTSQIQRAAISIPSNIAEGYGRNAAKEYVRFLNIARGSKYELETQLVLSVRIGYLTQSDIEHSMTLCNEIGKMLNSLINKLMPNA